MGRPSAVYQPQLAGERECLNCGDPFTPLPHPAWAGLYCQEACWIANNGGPRRHRTAYRPRPAAGSVPDPVPEILEAVAPTEPLTGGIVWPPQPPAPKPAHLRPSPAPRLVVVGVTTCPRCDTTHKVYGYRGAP